MNSPSSLAGVFPRSTEPRTRSESQVRLELAERAALLELSFDAILVRDAMDRVTYWNRGAEEMYGWKREEALGQVTHTLLKTEFPEPLPLIQEKLQREGRWSGELVHTRRDGSRLIVVTRWALQPGEAGRIVAILESNTDITERKETEDALLHREQELAAFFEESPLSLLWVAPDGTILRGNRATLELLGYGGDELRGQHVADFNADLGGTERVLQRLSLGETVSDCRLRFWHKKGLLKYVLVDANGLWEGERLVHSRWFLRDITQRVELEQEILTICERERNRLGQDLHDDLCQQLTGIEFLSQTLAASLAKKSPAEGEQGRELAAIVRHLMVQTRDLARGLSPLSLEADGLMVALRELAGRTEKLFGRACRFVCDSPVPVTDQTVGVHAYRIAQEAVGNAVKHSRAKLIEIRLTARSEGFGLEILDDGVGISRVQAHPAGMGLQIMQYRAEVIGASLFVQPNPQGRGTRIYCEVSRGRLLQHERRPQ